MREAKNLSSIWMVYLEHSYGFVRNVSKSWSKPHCESRRPEFAGRRVVRDRALRALPYYRLWLSP